MRWPRSRLLLAIVCVALAAVADARGAPAAESPRGPHAPVRHVDPATVAADADPAAVFGWYLDALSRFASWRFREGRRLLLQLDRANLPPEIRSMVGEGKDLAVNLGSILEAADGWLRDAAALIEAGKVEAARPLLEQLRGYVRRGDVLFDDLVRGIQEVGRRSGVGTLAPDAPHRRAYEDLQRLAARARAMLLAYGAVARDPGSVAALGRLLPYQTEFDLSVPPLVYPGRAFAVSGAVTERAPVPSKGRLLTLRLDDQALAEVPLGPFRREVALPAGTLLGARAVVAEVPSQGRYLGAQARRSIRVVQAVPDLRVRVPGTVVAPGRFEISGIAVSEFGPAARAAVHAQLGGALGETRTSEDGGFRLALDLPGAVNLVGTEEISLRLLPAEPWHAPVALTVGIFVVNLVNAGLVAALLLPAGGLAYVGFRRRASGRMRQVVRRAEVERAGVGPVGVEGAGAGPVPVPEAVSAEPELVAGALPETALRQALLDVYREALRGVQKATGLSMTPSTTMREFARQAGPLLGGAADAAFLGITGLAERALYSHHRVTADLVDEARRLNTRLGEELRLAGS